MPAVYFYIFLLFIMPSVGSAFASSRLELKNLLIAPAGYGGGGRFTAVAVDPHNSQTVFIGSDVAGIFKSTDGGNTFQLKGRGLEGFAVAAIAIHPALPEQVLILTDDGLYISEDSGESWNKKSSVIRYGARFFGSQLLVFLNQSVWIATDANGVFQITMSTTRSAITPVPGLVNIKVNGLAVYRDSLYAATAQGVYRYTKGQWQALNAGLSPDYKDITDIAAHPHKRLYLAEKTTGVFVWNEKTQAWEQRSPKLIETLLNRPMAYKAITIDPHNPDKIFLATHPETWPHVLFLSTDGGNYWEAINSFSLDSRAPENWAKTQSAIESIAFAPQNSQIVFMSDWWNVWKSSDGGKRWFQLHQGLQNTVVNDIKVHPENPQKIFLSMSDNGLMVSEDAGGSWKRKMTGVVDGHAQELEISHQHPSTMYLLMNPWWKKDRIYVYRSRDAGETWQDISFPKPLQPLPPLGYVDGLATNLELDPASDSVAYVATNGYGIFKTVNGGDDWKPINRGLDTPYIKGPRALLVHPRNPRILFASTLQGGIYKSTDAGESWNHVSTNHPFTFGMAIDPANPLRIIACGPVKKLFLSEDEGHSWKEVLLPGRVSPAVACNAVMFHPLQPQLVFVGTLGYNYRAADGLYISQDRGQTFQQVPCDAPLVNTNIIEIPAVSELSVLIGFNGIGLYRVKLHEDR